ncbi:MAG: PQQ-dependent sugar dehydrogenase [Verrucomicrobiae bacterium]|nr:PQQ-dependent sugar dehydrogenase [Verrucomicrobiae bacterium]
MASLLRRLALLLLAGTAVSTALGDPIRVALKPVAEGLTSPLSLIPLPDQGALVVDQVGYLRVLGANGVLSPEPALTLTNRLSPINHGSFDERGLIDAALHPGFAQNRRLFVTYTAPRRDSAPADWDCTLRLSEFQLPAGSPPRVDAASEKILFEVDKPYANHNSGRIVFGPDGLLYMGVGDGGNANDQGKRPETGNGQNLRTHLGKILRLDVDQPSGGRAYGIPSDNPFADGREGLPEIYAYGLRNPWGLSFDRSGSGELFAADVGQDLFEEVDIIRKGGNYGWSLREGFEGFSAKSPKTPPADAPTTGARGEPLLAPILQYNHTGLKKDPDAQGISITGGYVYRGKALPALEGRYVFGDWSRNWGVPQGVLLAATRPAASDARWTLERLEIVEPAAFAAYITGFGLDRDGELYVLTNGSNGLTPGKGRIWKLVPAAP